MTKLEELEALMSSIGTKRIKTKDIEVERQDIDKMVKAQERLDARNLPASFCELGGCYVVPAGRCSK